MSAQGRVRVTVRARRIPVGTATLQLPVYRYQGAVKASRVCEAREVVLYDTVYDEAQLRAIDQGKRLSQDLGLKLEVVDLSKVSPFRRLWSALTGAGSAKLSLEFSSFSESNRKAKAPAPLSMGSGAGFVEHSVQGN
jgi:hypothetical protein